MRAKFKKWVFLVAGISVLIAMSAIGYKAFNKNTKNALLEEATFRVAEEMYGGC